MAEPAGMTKTTLRIPVALWDATRKRAIDEHRDAQDIVADALTEYLRRPLVRLSLARQLKNPFRNVRKSDARRGGAR
jgi:hypothetical protein